MVLKIGFRVDLWLLPLDIYKWAHCENIGRTFRKGVRPWAQDFVWPNASLHAVERLLEDLKIVVRVV